MLRRALHEGEVAAEPALVTAALAAARGQPGRGAALLQASAAVPSAEALSAAIAGAEWASALDLAALRPESAACATGAMAACTRAGAWTQSLGVFA